MTSKPPKKKILFLAANPKGTIHLRLDEEARKIAEGLRQSEEREFALDIWLAARPRDIRRAMLWVKPQIVHFSGHGKGTETAVEAPPSQETSNRDIKKSDSEAEEEGLIFEDETGQPKLVDGATLAELFDLFADQVTCVVLNCCYSKVQAEVIAQYVPYVIGMHRAIGDEAAIAFAVGFYDALGAGCSIEDAYRSGCNAIRLERIPEHLTPVLFKQSKTPKQIFQRIRQSLFLVLPTSIGLTTLVIVMRLFGLFQPLELQLYDQMMWLQQIVPEPQDDRLLIIEATTEDIEQLPSQQQGFKQGSLSDQTLLKILKKLIQSPQGPPKAIGLDIYRDRRTETPELANLLKKSPFLFAVCNVGDRAQGNNGVKPPPEVPVERLGFTDFIDDNREIVRRQLLMMDDASKESPCRSIRKPQHPVEHSLGFRLTQHYLSQEKQLVLDDKLKLLKSDTTIFPRLHGWTTGSYLSDFSGYQILLNYRQSCDRNRKTDCSSRHVAERLSFKQMIEADDLSKYNLSNRIVLIGITGTTYYKDSWNTPLGEAAVPGVFVQAQMVSQLLGAVLDKQPLLRVWSLWEEILWILIWSLIGGIIARKHRSTQKLIVSGGIAFASLYVLCLICFVSPTKVWVPFLPASLTLMGTGGVILIRIQLQ